MKTHILLPLLALTLAACSNQPIKVVPPDTEIFIPGDALLPCPTLTKIPLKESYTFEEIAQVVEENVIVYKKCANQQARSIELIRLLSKKGSL